jgi:hypothetical protein
VEFALTPASVSGRLHNNFIAIVALSPPANAQQFTLEASAEPLARAIKMPEIKRFLPKFGEPKNLSWITQVCTTS